MQYHNILHIDDDEDDREIFQTALQRVTRDIHYTAFDSAVNALQMLSDNEVTTDLVFLDLNMPEMSGQQFLMECTKCGLLKHTPIIVLSTSAHLPTINLMKDLGAYEFITKPDNFEELVTKLRFILS